MGDLEGMVEGGWQVGEPDLGQVQLDPCFPTGVLIGNPLERKSNYTIPKLSLEMPDMLGTYHEERRVHAVLGIIK